MIDNLFKFYLSFFVVPWLLDSDVLEWKIRTKKTVLRFENGKTVNEGEDVLGMEREFSQRSFIVVSHLSYAVDNGSKAAAALNIHRYLCAFDGRFALDVYFRLRSLDSRSF